VAQLTGTMDPAWLKPPNGAVPKAEIVDYLRRTHHLRGALADFRLDEQQCAVSFKGPGYSADAFIDRATGRYDVTESSLGVVAILNDLHKGRDTGASWQLVIDVAAGLLVFIAFSGLVLLYFVHKHRLPGVLALGVGTAIVYAIYRLLVS